MRKEGLGRRRGRQLGGGRHGLGCACGREAGGITAGERAHTQAGRRAGGGVAAVW